MCVLWEKLLRVHYKSNWIRLPSRIPVGELTGCSSQVDGISLMLNVGRTVFSKSSAVNSRVVIQPTISLSVPMLLPKLPCICSALCVVYRTCHPLLWCCGDLLNASLCCFLCFAALFVWFIALAIPFFGVVNDLLGAFCVTFETFILPPLAFNLYYQGRPDRQAAAFLKPRCAVHSC
jgi:hypothetical protein